jgi:hypothetical protein
MHSAKLTILASLSLAMLAAMAWGYVGGLSLGIAYISVTSGATQGGAGVNALGGQLMVGWEQTTNLKYTARSPGIHVVPYFRFKAPLAPGWLYSFEHKRYSGPPGYGGVGLICPLWFAALPCAIAPIAWLRRRHRRETRGFPVDGSETGKMQSDRQTPTGV